MIKRNLLFKKLITGVLTSFIAISGLGSIPVSAQTCDPGTHQWGNKTFLYHQEATCKSNGSNIYQEECSICGTTYDYSEIIKEEPPVGHEIEYLSGRCKYCFSKATDLGLEDPMPNRHQHYYETIEVLGTIKPDCLFSGADLVKQKCVFCDDILETRIEYPIREALHHDYVDGICTRCGMESEKQLPPGQHTHDFQRQSEFFKCGPHCESSGFESGMMICEECGDSYFITFLDPSQPATGHNYVNGVCTDCFIWDIEEYKKNHPTEPTTEKKEETSETTTESETTTSETPETTPSEATTEQPVSTTQARPETTETASTTEAATQTEPKEVISKPSLKSAKNKKGKKLQLTWKKVKWR